MRKSVAALSIGIVLVQDFTMLALSALVDTLRLAADDGDRSRPIDCAWRVMSDHGRAVRASNGILVEPTSDFVDPEMFDYVALVGGTLHRGPHVSDATVAYLHRAAEAGIPIVGLCTASFILARAGLMNDRRACVSWFHRDELCAEFPDLDVVADALFVVDRDRITCAGGTSVVHMTSFLVERHLGPGRSEKGLRIMLEDQQRAGSSPQPPPRIIGFEKVDDPRIRRAMLRIEQHGGRPVRSSLIASEVGLTERHLNRLFQQVTGSSVQRFARRLRLERARRLLDGGGLSVTQIAFECGFADASHLVRDFRRAYGSSPAAHNRARLEPGKTSP